MKWVFNEAIGICKPQYSACMYVYMCMKLLVGRCVHVCVLPGLLAMTINMHRHIYIYSMVNVS